MRRLTEIQRYQEEGYNFPYHYLDLRVDEYRLINHVEYVSRLNIVKDLLRPYIGQLILDAGCGDGRFIYELRNENVKLVGVDYSERALAFARAFNPEVEFYAQDLKTLSLPYPFDTVVLIETLEHFVPDDIPAILESLSRVLRPEGQLVLTVPSVNMPLIKKHYQHFSEESLRRTLKGHFRITNCLGYTKVRGFSLRANLSRASLSFRIYSDVRRISTWLYPFRNIKSVQRLFECVNNYYKTHLAVGKPEECSGIVAVCKKT